MLTHVFLHQISLSQQVNWQLRYKIYNFNQLSDSGATLYSGNFTAGQVLGNEPVWFNFSLGDIQIHFSFLLSFILCLYSSFLLCLYYSFLLLLFYCILHLTSPHIFLTDFGLRGDYITNCVCAVKATIN
jgi:hypothetical protein